MGWFFQMSIECGNDERLARAVAAHFEGYSFMITEASSSTCATGIIVDADRNRWVIISPSGLSTSGISTKDDAHEMTLAGRHLYARLHSSPPFRYAIAGVESEGFRSFTELKQLESSLFSRLNGLVLSIGVWETLGQPAGFVEFRTDYLWRPYLGESLPSH